VATVVALMDRDTFAARTDVIVVVGTERRELLWVPRDLWCQTLRDRINVAWARAGLPALTEALAEHDLVAEHGICLLPRAVGSALEAETILMPLAEPLEFWYPLAPHAPIEEGRKVIRFEPPLEELRGERIHQWLGARYRTSGAGSDLQRIERQKQLLALMLGDGFDFRRFLANEEDFRISDLAAFDDLRQVRPGWSMRTLDGLWPQMVEGKDVLRRMPVSP
jgi:hypothetical protein